MGVRESPVRGRAGGCAEAPLAGLPPHGPRSLTQSAAEVAPTGATATRAGSSTCIFVSGRVLLKCVQKRTDALLRRTCRFHAAQSTSYTSTNSLRRLRGERTPLFVHVDHGGTDLRTQDARFRRPTLPGKDPALEWAFLGSGAAFYDQPARGSLRERATSSASPAR